MIPLKWLQAASQRLDGKTHRTPLTYDAERGLYIKWENRQKTGSFKVRGALNRALILEGWEREMGLVTASAGNHGQGVALAGQIVSASVRVFASKNAPAVKIEAMRELGATVELIEGGYHDAEEAGLAFAKRNDAVWISPSTRSDAARSSPTNWIAWSGSHVSRCWRCAATGTARWLWPLRSRRSRVPSWSSRNSRATAAA